MVEASRPERERPLSPHLQVWRWHITLAASISTRFTGVALYAGWLILAAFALCLATGPEASAQFVALARSIPGQVVLFAVAVSLFYHLAAGVRHLFFDAGVGMLPRQADVSAFAAFAFGLLAAVAVFVFAHHSGAPP